MSSLACNVLFLSVCAVFVAADLPVHCPHHTIKGTWEFSMSEGKHDKNLKCAKVAAQGQRMCFYGSCYNNKVIGEADFKEDHKYTVSIADPNVVVTTDQHGKKEKGTWTTVYDEGFEVDTPSKHFFAFSKFGGGQSLCKQTWPGWHREANNPDSNRWGCYQGNKISEDVSEEDLAFLTVEERRAHEDSIASIQIEESPAATTAYELPTEATSTKMYQPEHEMVARINAKEGGTWKAKVYPEFEKMTMAAFQNIAGFRPSRRLPRDNRPPRPSDSEELIQVPDASNLPETLDWRNMDGVNYVDDVVNQGQCGSCYAVSTTSMINSRIRIITKNREKPQLNWHQVLQCDRYNQACAGGYPYLVEKYGQDFGFTKNGQCAQSTKDGMLGAALNPEGPTGHSNVGEAQTAGAQVRSGNPYIRVKDFGYVGGYYGGTTTAEMMQELHDNGPIVVGINGGYEMMHYDTGIFIETGEGSGKVRNDFERVDHAVLVVGWGQEGNNKYWIIKNSFGPSWGEHGYFRIRRGGDANGITSLVTFANPVLGDSEFFNTLAKKEAKKTE